MFFYNTQIAYYFIKNNEARSPQDSVNKIMILLNPRLTVNPTPEFLSKANVRILTKLSSLRTRGTVRPSSTSTCEWYLELARDQAGLFLHPHLVITLPCVVGLDSSNHTGQWIAGTKM